MGDDRWLDEFQSLVDALKESPTLWVVGGIAVLIAGFVLLGGRRRG